MNLSTLRLFMLALIFAWAQVCCCQAGAALGVAQRAIAAVDQSGNSCCGGCPSHSVTIFSDQGEDGNECPGLPCHDHGECGGCMPRAGSMPEGPRELIGEPGDVPAPPNLPPVVIDLSPGVVLCHLLRGNEHACYLAPPTLVRLHCALIV